VVGHQATEFSLHIDNHQLTLIAIRHTRHFRHHAPVPING